MKICLLFFVVSCVSSALVEMNSPSRKCYLMTIYPKQNLLLQIEAPIFQQRIKLSVEVMRNNKVEYEQVIKGSDERFAVEFKKAEDEKEDENLQVETCLKTESEEPVAKKYLILLKQFRNFDHLINKNSPSDLPYQQSEKEEILKMSERITKLYEEQISVYHQLETEEVQTEDELIKMKNQAFLYSIIETAIIIAFTIIEVALISKYI